MVYLLKSFILLTLLYGSFALLLGRETFHRFNRLALLGVLVASLLLPALRLNIDRPAFLCYEQEMVQDLSPVPFWVSAKEIQMPPVPANGQLYFLNITSKSDSRDEEDVALAVAEERGAPLLQCLYIAGVLVSLSLFIFQLCLFGRDVKGGIHTKDEWGNTVVIHGGDFAPYSFFHYIIISVSDYEQLRGPILSHEQAHIRFGHSLDLMLLELVKAVQWFNPFVYLLGRDLKAVHEYEADNAVLNLGIDAKTYQKLLVTKAVGDRLQTVVNGLNHHSLKKRIKMMHLNKSNRWRMTKAVVLPALMALAVVAFAKPKIENLPVTDDNDTANVRQENSEKKMLSAWRVPKDCKNPIVTKRGDGIIVTWLKGTWVEKDDGSFIEEHPVCTSPWLFHTSYSKIMLDGKELDIDNLPDLPASALKKVEIHAKDGKWINLITSPVQIPADVKGNINPELTILLTGTPPKDSGTKTSIWVRHGKFDGFSWKNYTFTSWKWDVEDIGDYLEEVAIRKDHSVRINVCRGVPQEHIERIKRLMSENGVTNYDFVRQ